MHLFLLNSFYIIRFYISLEFWYCLAIIGINDFSVDCSYTRANIYFSKSVYIYWLNVMNLAVSNRGFGPSFKIYKKYVELFNVPRGVQLNWLHLYFFSYYWIILLSKKSVQECERLGARNNGFIVVCWLFCLSLFHKHFSIYNLFKVLFGYDLMISATSTARTHIRKWNNKTKTRNNNSGSSNADDNELLHFFVLFCFVRNEEN